MCRPARWFGLLALLSLSLSALAAEARADDDEPQAPVPPALVPVRFVSIRDGELAELVKKGKRRRDPEEVVAQCTADCEQLVPPGPYRVRLSDANGREVGSTRASIVWPTTFQATDPATRAQAGWGTALAVLGSLTTGVGASWWLVSVLSQVDSPSSTPASVRLSETEAGMTALAGLAITVTGVAIFASNHGASRTWTDNPWRHVSLCVSPTEKGWIAGAGMSF